MLKENWTRWPPPRTNEQIQWENRCDGNMKALITMFVAALAFIIWLISITVAPAKTNAHDACRDVAAATDLSDGSIEVAKKLCANDSTSDQCMRAAPAAEYAARMALQVTKRCRASLEKHSEAAPSPDVPSVGLYGVSKAPSSIYWSYDKPTPPWKPE